MYECAACGTRTYRPMGDWIETAGEWVCSSSCALAHAAGRRRPDVSLPVPDEPPAPRRVVRYPGSLADRAALAADRGERS